jgi:shikimate kinase
VILNSKISTSGVSIMTIFEKRGQWCFRDESGKLHKFPTEHEAVLAAGFPVETAEEPLFSSSWLEDIDNAYEAEEE